MLPLPCRAVACLIVRRLEDLVEGSGSRGLSGYGYLVAIVSSSRSLPLFHNDSESQTKATFIHIYLDADSLTRYAHWLIL